MGLCQICKKQHAYNANICSLCLRKKRKTNKMRITVNTKYIKGEVELQFSKYQNGSPAIQAFSLYGEPEFTATVALDELPSEGCVFLKGWSENEGIPAALVKAGIVELTGRKLPTGYCEAEEAKLLVS